MLNVRCSPLRQQGGCSWSDALGWLYLRVASYFVHILSSAFPLQACRIAALISLFVASTNIFLFERTEYLKLKLV